MIKLLRELRRALNEDSLDGLSRLRNYHLFFKYYILKKFEPVISKVYDRIKRELPKQERLIWESDFDVLIILDACRYDIFAQIYAKYLINGYLVPTWSPASVTLDWLRKVWGIKYWDDIIYVTASPLINKLGMLPQFDARKHFREIIEVWDIGWYPELITVPPQNVNLMVKSLLIRYYLRGLRLGKDYRLVIHYVQPHAPYLGLSKLTRAIINSEIATSITDVAVRKLRRFHGDYSIDYLLLHILSSNLSSHRVRQLIRREYTRNLIWVLKHVAKLIRNLIKYGVKIVITSDHGELLGEYGLYYHLNLELPQLRVVPFLYIKRLKNHLKGFTRDS